MRRAISTGVSPRSRARKPKPPPWISRSAALRRDVGPAGAANPQKARKLHARRLGRGRVEGVAESHRADFLPRAGRGQNGRNQAGAARRSRTVDFGNRAAGQAAGEPVQFRDTGRDAFGSGAIAPGQVRGQTAAQSRIR